MLTKLSGYYCVMSPHKRKKPTQYVGLKRFHLQTICLAEGILDKLVDTPNSILSEGRKGSA